MKRTVTRDLTEGSPMKLILEFMLPLTLGMLFQQFYNMVDTMIVGKYLGVNALAGVGSTGSINFLVLGFCGGLCSGFAIPVAQKFGQKDYSDLRKYVANIAYLSVIFSAAITLGTCIPCKAILQAMNTDPAFFQEAYDYIFVIFLGIPTMVMYNVLSSIIRSLGDSRTPLYFLILSSVLNIVLDLVAVLWLDMGVKGPAWATVISQGVSGFGCLVYMIKTFDILKMTREERRPSLFHVGKLCAMGFPMGLQNSIIAIGSLVLQSAINGFGTIYVAAVTAGGKVSQLLCSALDALGITATTFAGQNIGAMRLDRVKAGVKGCFIIGTSYSLFAFLIMFFFGKDISLLFLDTKDSASVQQVLPLIQQFLNINGALYFFLGLIFVFRFSIQGMGFPNSAILGGVLEMIARSVVALALTPMLGYTAICWANPAAWIAADIFLVPCYYFCLKKLTNRYSHAPVTD